MEKTVNVNENTPLKYLFLYADKVTTPEGNTYYFLPVWFKQKGCWFSVHLKDLPEDLSEFICKAGLGQPNPQIQKAEL